MEDSTGNIFFDYTQDLRGNTLMETTEFFTFLDYLKDFTYNTFTETY